jgi:hypothetical protein
VVPRCTVARGMCKNKTVLRRKYKISIPGDSPAFMPFDKTLNQDIHMNARYHVALTLHLDNDDPRKFSFATPNEIYCVYLRLVGPVTGGAPGSNRTIQDCEKLMRSLERIR